MKKILILLTLCAVVLSAAAVGIWEYGRVIYVCDAEAGCEVSAQDFLKNPGDRAYFTIDSDVVDTSMPGEYTLNLQLGWFRHKCRLVVRDTMPPTAKPLTVNLEIGERCEADDFVQDIEDATNVKADYAETPDFERYGRQEVKILLTDEGGNTSEITSELIVSQTVREMNVEAGDGPPDIKDFVIEGESAQFITPVDLIDYNHVADSTVMLRVDGNIYETLMHITDTVPPRAEVHDITGYAMVPRAAEDFVTSVDDATNVEVSYVQEPDVTISGEQIVELCFVDEGGNESFMTSKLILEEDEETPIIIGAADLDVVMGQAVSYMKYVKAEDNCPEGLSLTVDSSAVNMTQEGIYPVIYTAEDLAGNRVSVEVSLTVKPQVYDPEEVNALADEVLANILTEEMTPMQKARAIYNYVRANVGYINESDKGDWVKAAYEGLVNRQGDCYVYACTSKVLLTRAGIENMDIEKIPTSSHHYWNLVNLGEGWYHFDTTPRTDHSTVFMWTDEDVKAYSAEHWRTYNYDPSLYPEIN